MRMQIENMTIKSFRGIKYLVVTMLGCDSIISGRNATGKSTVYNAFLWLLFGKDGDGARPEVKPVDGNGERVCGVDTEVTATITVDNSKITLRKVLHENWRKVANSIEPVYVSDETLCWVNDVPKKVDKEYLPYVLSLVGGNEKTFKLLTDTNAFMRLHWTDRRTELLDITKSDIDRQLQAKGEYKEIPDILNGATTEDARKRLMAQRKRHAEDLKAIPSRIDELHQSVEMVSDKDIKAAESEIAKITLAIQAIEDQMTGGDAIDQLISIKSKAAMAMQAAKTAARREIDEKIAETEMDIALYSDKQNCKAREIASLEQDIKTENTTIKGLEKQRLELLAQYREAEAEPCPEARIEAVCPTCGQDIPYNQILEARGKHVENWNLLKTDRLAVIKQQGIKIKDRQVALIEYVDNMRQKLAAFIAEIDALGESINVSRDKLKEFKAFQVDYEVYPAYIEAKKEYDAADQNLIKQGSKELVEGQRAEKQALQCQIDQHKVVILTAQQSEKTKARIMELEGEKRNIGDRIAGIDRQMDLLAEYISARCAALENDINGHFDTIRWKLFEEDKSGGVHDCCVATVNGVDYDGGLNSSAKTNCGIEIIRVLSDVYGVSVPCFVDNSEGINYVSDTGGQMIQLKVTEEPTLTITVFDKEDREYGATA